MEVNINDTEQLQAFAAAADSETLRQKMQEWHQEHSGTEKGRAHLREAARVIAENVDERKAKELLTDTWWVPGAIRENSADTEVLEEAIRQAYNDKYKLAREWNALELSRNPHLSGEQADKISYLLRKDTSETYKEKLSERASYRYLKSSGKLQEMKAPKSKKAKEKAKVWEGSLEGLREAL